MQRLPMSDQTTPGLREQIASRLSQVWPYEIHLNVENNTNKIRGAAAVVMDVVQPELDRRDAEIERLQDLISAMRADYHTEIRQRAEAYQAAIASTAGDAMAHRLCGMNLGAAIRRAEQAEAEAAKLRGWDKSLSGRMAKDLAELKATIARVKALAEDMRTWCSPRGIAVTYAQRIDEAIEPSEPATSDLPAVRAFAAKLDPRKEVKPDAYLDAAMRRTVERMARDVQRRMDGG